MHSSLHPAHRRAYVTRATILAVLSLCAAPLVAQSAATSATPVAPASADADTIELSPFVIDAARDEGWIANGTLLANRTNTSLKDTPVSIDALTREFLMDVGAFNDFEAAKWVANVQVADESGRSDFGRYSFRGIQNQWGTNRNFFRWYVPNDGYNLERIDFGRGSNSLMFGDNEPGGQATVYTKRAILGRSFTRLLGQVGSFNGYRMELDRNQNLTPKFAVRLNVTRNSEGRYFDFNKFSYEGQHGTLSFRPSANTLIRLEGEFGGHERIWGNNVHSIYEKPAAGLGFSNAVTVLPDGTLVDQRTVNGVQQTRDGTLVAGTPWLNSRDRSDVSGSLYTLLDRDTRQVGAFTFSGFDRKANWAGTADVEDRHYSTFSAYVEHRFSQRLVGEIAFNQQKQWRDATALNNTYNTKVDFLGRRYFDATYLGSREVNTVQTPRMMVSYNLDQLAWMKQVFVATAEYRGDTYRSTQRQLRWVNAPGVTPTTDLLGTSLQPVFRIYQDDPKNYAPTLEKLLPLAPAGTRPFTTAEGGQVHQARAYSISASGSYFRGRLQSLLGLRYDSNDTAECTAWVNSAANKLPNGELQWPGDFRSSARSRWNYSPFFNLREPTHTLGLVYMLSPSTNVYVTDSTSFRFNGSTNFMFRTTGPILGATKEAGLKSAFLDNKLQWNLTWYDLVRENVVANFDNRGLSAAQMQAVVNAGLDSSSPEYVVWNGSSTRDTRTQLSRGWETSLLFFPTRGLNVRIAGAYAKVTQIDAFPAIRGLLAAAEARNPTDPVILNNLALLKEGIRLAGADHRRVTGAGAMPFSFNYALDYRFRNESRFKGLSLGVNGNYNDNFTLGYYASDILPVKGGAATTVHATAGYSHRLLGLPFNFRINVYNIIANKYVDGSIVTINNNTGFARRIGYGAPLSLRFTTNVEF